MIRKLRWKFTAIMMTIVTILLVIIFASLYYTAKMNFERRGIQILRSILDDNYGNTPPPSQQDPSMPPSPRRSGPAPEEDRTPVLVAEETKDGSLLILRNRIYGMTQDEAQGLVASVKGLKEDSGVLKSQNLRYMRDRIGPEGSTRYAFADIYAEHNSLHWQIIHSIVIGTGSFAMFFICSVLWSGWALRPISQAWDQQQQFIADASHELKTPLTVILSNINLLVHSPDIPDSANKRRMEHIQSESVRMKHLVESLLVLARSDSMKSAAVHAPLDFSYLVSSSIMFFEPMAFEMGKSISSGIEDRIMVRGDEKKLVQLVGILLDNACKYSEDGSCIKVNLSCKAKEALLTVTNEGIPLTKEELGRLFLRFYRADPSRGSIPGYGLGLSIAQNIVTEHKGKIGAASDGIRANTFSVSLPLCGRAAKTGRGSS